MADKVEWDAERLKAVIQANTRGQLIALANHYERLVQESFRTAKSGRLYGVNASKLKALRRFRAGTRKTRPGGLHRASAAGQAPAVDTGALSKSITHQMDTTTPGEASVVVGVSIQGGRGLRTGTDDRSIAERLELGTGTMAPRPSWRPALEQLRVDGQQIIKAASIVINDELVVVGDK